MKTKMSLAVSLVVVGIIAILSLAGVSFFQEEIRRNVSTQQFTLVSSLAAEIDDKLLTAQGELTSVAANFPRDFSRAQEHLDQRLDTRLIFDNCIALFSPAGKMLAMAPYEPDMFARNYSNREYFRRTMESGRPYISKPFSTLQKHGRPIIMMTAPLLDGQGRIEAILVGSIDLTRHNFLGKLAGTRIGKGGYLYLIAPDRTMIMHPDGSRIMRNDIPPGANQLLDRALAGFEGSGETVTSRGLPVLAAFKRLRSTGWILAASTPISEAYGSVTRAEQMVVPALVAAAIVSVAIVFILMNFLTGPLATFTRHVQSFAEKSGDERFFSRDRGDEIGILAAAFNRMIETLDRSRGELEESHVQLQCLIAGIEEQNRDLEHANAELKATQTQMLQQEKMASIGQLAAGVAHEINNPIGFVASNLGTLRKYIFKLTEFVGFQEERLAALATPEVATELAEKRKALKLDYILSDAVQLIGESLEGTDRVGKIVQDLKRFSRVDEAECKPVNLNDCLESTLNIAWNELKYKATVKKELGELPFVQCNPQHLNQVFLNLLVNAAHAIEGQGEITLKSWESAGSVFVSVADTGCGISEAIRNRIFEPFFTTKEVGKGTGLGLSISYDIVKKHNGELLLRSEVGKGTTFTVRLPVGSGH